MKPLQLFLMLGVSMIATVSARAGAAPAVRRFVSELAAFSALDRAAAATAEPGGTLVLGSSSIRLWDTTADLASFRPVNRGFGGATVVDVLDNYDLLVRQHHPGTVLVYVGENDIAAGRLAAPVATDVLTLLGKLRADFPKARIAYLSMKPSPLRWKLRKELAEANMAIRAGTKTGGGFDYIDVASGLITPGDMPDAECFRADGLHLSAVGYKRWRDIVGTYLGGPQKVDTAKLPH